MPGHDTRGTQVDDPHSVNDDDLIHKLHDAGIQAVRYVDETVKFIRHPYLDLGHCLHIQPGGDFIKNPETRPMGEEPGQENALLLPARYGGNYAVRKGAIKQGHIIADESMENMPRLRNI